MKILLIDNYDSFTFNLSHYLRKAGAEVVVLRNDHFDLFNQAAKAQALVISPGPSSPGNSGESPQIVKRFFKEKPILGVCLGMQIINEVFGGTTLRAPYPVHGKQCRISVLHQQNIFSGLPEQILAARYHSLICGSLGQNLLLTAKYRSIFMAFQHRFLPVFGVQFHPESFLTPRGQQIINNFIGIVHETAA